MILALDTCLPACSVALRGEGVRLARTEVLGTGHAERLAPMVAEMLEEAGLRARDLMRLCVTVGPGSFMGTRVGLSFAKGLALPRGLPCVPISTLHAIALGAPDAPVLIDARRGQAYALPPGPPGPGGLGAKRGAPALVTHDEARALALTGRPVGVGLSAMGLPGADTFPDPALMAAHAETADPSPLRPFYLRAPDAKPGKPAL